jgi:hypothetical protein
VYGNCQASAIRAILRTLPWVTETFEVRYASSFNPEVSDHLTPEDLARCAVFFEQHDPRTYASRDQLPTTCEIVTFPSVDCNLLWPWSAVNPANAPELPDFPDGRFPYGDAILMRCVKDGMADEDIVRYYLERAWIEHSPPMDRLQSLERSRLEAREKHCDVKMAEFFFDRFRDTRLHWTINHPTTIALCELTLRLLRLVLPEAEDMERSELVHHVRFRLGEPLGPIGVPIHAEVARALTLRWHREDTKYPYYKNIFTYEEYIRAFVQHAQAAQAELAPAS